MQSILWELARRHIGARAAAVSSLRPDQADRKFDPVTVVGGIE
jgi:hypothetical protein